MRTIERDDGIKMFILDSEKDFVEIARDIIPNFEDSWIVIIVNNHCSINLFENLIDQLALNPNIQKLGCNDWGHKEAYLSIEHKKLLLKPNVFRKILESLNTEEDENGTYISPTDLNFLVENEEVFNFILVNEEIKDALSDFKPIKQMFNKSCAAHSIMSSLSSRGEISYSGLSELTIYKEIWSSRGEIACPKRMKEFMGEYGYTAVLIEDKNITNVDDFNLKWLYSSIIEMFKGKHNDNGINEDTFPNDSQLFLLVGGPHIVYAERLSTGEIILQDPSRDTRSTFPSIELFLNREHINNKQLTLCGFSGLAFSFFKPRPLKSLTLETPVNFCNVITDSALKNI